MKKFSHQFAALLFLTGVFLFGLVHVGIAIHSVQYNDGLLDALNGIQGWIPYLMSITFMAIGGFIFLDAIVDERGREENKGKIYQYVGDKE
ncbi:MAG: hypothetical protein ABWX61_00540 [Paenisporosarcina sp.]